MEGVYCQCLRCDVTAAAEAEIFSRSSESTVSQTQRLATLP